MVIGYEGTQIVEQFNNEYANVPITYGHQRDRLGLAHATVQAAPYVDRMFLVVNGDNVFGTSLGPVVEEANCDGTDGALAVETVSRETASKTGVIESNKSSDRDCREAVESPVYARDWVSRAS